ncbi:hypothetical protein GCM10025863_19470 [Microbacterium suwonense]|uniref:Uncharacterized protein n=1 Tax=Microbacterium suwonense TaxID=683047 RepID=A0ABM8FUH2_9MICO|nr:hypothetical protein GCM10025863_19470 [Microbacterium suwonense]
MPERVRVQIDAEDRTAMAEADIGDEGVDAGDVLRRRLVRWDVHRGEIPIPGLCQPGAERTGHGRFGK